MNNQKIYINHIPTSYNATQVKELFTACGTITEINYPLDKKTHKPKGYAFITFEDTNATQNALQKNHEEIEGQVLIVEIAKEKSEKIKIKVKNKSKINTKAKDNDHNDQ